MSIRTTIIIAMIIITIIIIIIHVIKFGGISYTF